RVLGGAAVLHVGLPVDGVDQAAVQVQLVRERHPRATLLVVGGDALVGGAGHRLQAERGQQFGIRAVLGALDGELEALLPGRLVDQLGEHAAAVGVLRVGTGARAAGAAGLAAVVALVAPAMAEREQARPAVAAEGAGEAAEAAVGLAV